MLINGGQFGGISRLDVLDHVDHKFTDEVKHFKVMILELHLHIETSELAQMTVSVRVLGAENGTDLEDSLQIGTKRHLLVKLRTLSKASILFKVFQLEDVGTAF